MFFDTHAHYSPDDGPFQDWTGRAFDARVRRILLCATGWDETCFLQGCAAAAEGVFFAAGIHPQEAERESSHAPEEFRRFLADPRCLAVGEIGLDYYYTPESREAQKKLLAGFLDLALEADKPVIIHCRDREDRGPAYEDACELLKPFSDRGGRILLHAFSGSPEMLQLFLPAGAYFGVGGMLTFKKADNIRTVVSHMPMDRILLETDSPYLAPVPFRGKPNHPALLPYVASFLAAERGMTAEQIEELTTHNAETFFRLPSGED